METLNFKSMTGVELIKLKEKLSEIKVVESGDLTLGYEKKSFRNYCGHYDTIRYSSIILSKLVETEKPFECKNVDAFSDKDCDYREELYYYSFRPIISFKQFLINNNYPDIEFYTLEELYCIYNELTRDYEHWFVSFANNEVITLKPSIYERNPETGILIPKLIYTRPIKMKY